MMTKTFPCGGVVIDLGDGMLTVVLQDLPMERSGFFLSKLLSMIRPVRCPIGFHSGWGALEYLMTRMDKAFEIGLFEQLTRCIPKEFGQKFYLGLL
jgi:hypothetical protein